MQIIVKFDKNGWVGWLIFGFSLCFNFVSFSIKFIYLQSDNSHTGEMMKCQFQFNCELNATLDDLVRIDDDRDRVYTGKCQSP